MKEKCFVAGTLVKTPHGEVLIESIVPGDLIETPFGPSKVCKVHVNKSDDLSDVEFSNGKHLVGTSDHKVFTWDKGWVNLDTLSLHSKTEHVNNLWLWRLANLFFTKTTSTTFKQLVDIISVAGTNSIRSRKEFYTGLFGLTISDLFPKINVFTTLTGIGKTAASTISPFLKAYCI